MEPKLTKLKHHIDDEQNHNLAVKSSKLPFHAKFALILEWRLS